MSKKQIVDAVRADLVQVHKIILTPGQRPETTPASTRALPYEGWIKGFLLDNEAKIGDTVRIETFIGREICGTLVEVDPIYGHSFGKPQRDLLSVAIKAKKRNKGEPNCG